MTKLEKHVGNFLAAMLIIVFGFAIALAPITTQSEPLKGSIIHSKVKGLVGMTVNTKGYIGRVYYKSPAQCAGLLPHDRIIKVNFEDFTLGRIFGNEGDIIYFTIMRELPDITLPSGVHYDRTEVPLTFKVEYTDAQKIDHKTPPENYYEEKKILIWGPDC